MAGFGRKLMALVIDWFACILLSRLLFGQFAYGSNESGAVVLILFAGEVPLLTWLIGSSFGQRLLGLVVVRTDGGRMSLWRAALRTLLICLVIPAVVYDADGRGLHDKAVDSVVIRTR